MMMCDGMAGDAWAGSTSSCTFLSNICEDAGECGRGDIVEATGEAAITGRAWCEAALRRSGERKGDAGLIGDTGGMRLDDAATGVA